MIMQKSLSIKRVNGKTLLRRIIFYLLRPKPPLHPEPFIGPVLVVGSAPLAHLPEGFDEKFCVMTVNGSQSVLKRWDINDPDVTFMQFRQVYGTNENAVAVRRVLTGERTGLLYVIRWNSGPRRLIEGLAAFNYRYEALRIISRKKRMSLFAQVTGILNCEENLEGKFSNGITAVLYAIYNGASAVIISGIDPASTGHTYNELGLERHHSQSDRDILMLLNKMGYAIYTADPAVALSTGLPLWRAESRSDVGSTEINDQSPEQDHENTVSERMRQAVATDAWSDERDHISLAT
jgi:hypothetical protein